MARAQSCGTDSGAKKRSRSEDSVTAVRNSDDDTRKILRDCLEYLLGASFKTPARCRWCPNRRELARSAGQEQTQT